MNLYRNKCDTICTQYSSYVDVYIKMFKFIHLNNNLNNIVFKHHYYNIVNFLWDL